MPRNVEIWDTQEVYTINPDSLAASQWWVSHHPPTLYPGKIPSNDFRESQTGAEGSEEGIEYNLEPERIT